MSTTSERNFITVESWHGESGLSGRRMEFQPESNESQWAATLAIMEEFGCGAWTGRTACGNPVTSLALGASGLYHMAYRSFCGPTIPVHVGLCDEHAGPLWQMSRDMTRQLRRLQERKFRDVLQKLNAADREEEVREILIVPLDWGVRDVANLREYLQRLREHTNPGVAE